MLLLDQQQRQETCVVFRFGSDRHTNQPQSVDMHAHQQQHQHNQVWIEHNTVGRERQQQRLCAPVTEPLSVQNVVGRQGGLLRAHTPFFCRWVARQGLPPSCCCHWLRDVAGHPAVLQTNGLRCVVALSRILDSQSASQLIEVLTRMLGAGLAAACAIQCTPFVVSAHGATSGWHRTVLWMDGGRGLERRPGGRGSEV